MKHTLTHEQQRTKDVILKDAQNAYKEDIESYADFLDAMDWRLVRIGGAISIDEHPGAFEEGDITIGRKETKVTTIPWVHLYSSRARKRFKIQIHNPITFLED
jgi:hypothetical protein